MRAKKMGWFAVLITVAAALAAVPGFAQQEQTSTGVARVSLIRGDVSMMRGDSGTWVAVTVNTPLVPGDTIVTGAGSRAEVQLDYSNVLRLDQNAQAKIADLNASRIQLQVAHGTVDLAVVQGNQTESEVDTPNVAVQPLQPGTYRIDVSSDELSVATVRDGQAQISTPQGSTNVNAGNQITVEGSQNPQYQIAAAQPLDGWDNWNQERNAVIARASNYDHVNQYYTGAQDLNTYGRWVRTPDYDWCWTPYVDAGWVPYSNGRWVWEPYYGWTWVSYSPWGWAPYHYGRWLFYDNAWCWWPGAVTPYYRPLWAPAYVSFIGFGYGYRNFGFGFGYGFGSIGWFPLGPRDRFDRWWGRGHSFHVESFNNYYGRGDFSRGGRGYRGSNAAMMLNNAHFRRSITTMPADRFGRQATFRNHQTVSAATLRNASFVRGTLPVVPTHASLTASNRAAVVPRGAMNRANNARFFSRGSAAPRGNQNHSFNSQTSSIRQMVQSRNHQAPGANSGQGTVRAFSNGRGQNSGRTVRAFGGRTAPSGASGNQAGRRQVGAPNAQAGANTRGGQQRSNGAAVNRQNPRDQSTQAGWNRFGNRASGTQPSARVERRGPAPVVRQTPQSRQSNPPRGATNPRPNQSGWNRFSGNAPASSRQAPGNSQRSTPRAAPSGQNQRNGGGNSQRFTPQSAPRNQGRSFSGQSSQNRGGSFHRFTPQSAPQNGNRSSGFSRGASQSRSENRGGSLQRFTPQSSPRNGNPSSSFSRSGPQSHNQGRAGWSQFTPRAQAPAQNRGGSYNGSSQRGYSSPRYESRPSYGSRSYSRPPLRLNKPIVTERRSQSYSAPRGNSSYRGGGGQRGSAPHYSRGSGGGGSRGSSPHYSSHSSGGRGRH
ncbi:MAG TPA: DUF6600 domain-containing protein [Terriglobia bacterium]|nr:DUF6600 domain-containing protein [Terriglobia bacterium]